MGADGFHQEQATGGARVRQAGEVFAEGFQAVAAYFAELRGPGETELLPHTAVAKSGQPRAREGFPMRLADDATSSVAPSMTRFRAVMSAPRVT